MKKTLMILMIMTMITLPVSFAEYGATAAQNDNSLQLAEMLNYAIQDEYLARAEYNLIMDAFDVSRPFSNIERAENKHIDWLTGLFDDYGYVLPKDEAVVTPPASLAEAFQAGVMAEKLNIAMYEKFLSQELPQDVRVVFTALKNASEKHLKAFERNLSSGNTSFKGRGRWRNTTDDMWQNTRPNKNGKGF